MILTILFWAFVASLIFGGGFGLGAIMTRAKIRDEVELLREELDSKK
jgi:hypothetical protein